MTRLDLLSYIESVGTRNYIYFQSIFLQILCLNNFGLTFCVVTNLIKWSSFAGKLYIKGLISLPYKVMRHALYGSIEDIEAKDLK